MFVNKTTVSFSASADSAAIAGGLVLGIQIPASFGATSLVFLYCDTAAGTFIPVCDETNTAIGITTDASSAKFYDLSNIFPIALAKINNNVSGFIKLRANTSITKDIVVFREAV